MFNDKWWDMHVFIQKPLNLDHKIEIMVGFTHLVKAFTITLLVVIQQFAVGQQLYKLQGKTQGTTYHISYYDTVNAPSKQAEILQILTQFEVQWSTFLPFSTISRLNQSTLTPIAIDEDWKKCFLTGKRIWKETDGYFDMTVAPLVNYWGFGFTKGKPTEIDTAHVDSLLQCIGMEQFELTATSIKKKTSCVQLDASAIAKGYSVDLVSQYFTKKGIESYFVEIGGEMIVSGTKPDGHKWIVAIDAPLDSLSATDDAVFNKVFLSNKAMATSGNYRKYYKLNGHKYAHTINPKTGFPTHHHLLSVSIIARTCMEADAYATSCMAMGLEKSMTFLAEHPKLQALLIFWDSDKKQMSFKNVNGFNAYYKE